MRNISRAFAESLANLRSNFVQTFLSMFGIVIGVGALVAMLSVIDGLEALARRSVVAQSPLETMRVVPRTQREVDGVWVRRDTVVSFGESLHADFLAALPYAATAELTADGAAEARVGDTTRLGVKWLAATLPLHDSVHLVAGEWPVAVGADDRWLGAVVNQALALRLVAPDTAVARAVGRQLRLLGAEIVITGVAEASEGATQPELVLEYGALSRLDAVGGASPALTVWFAEVTDVAAGAAFAKTWFADRFTGVEDPVAVSTYEGALESVAQGFLAFRLVMGFLIGIAVVVGGVGVMNVLVMSVIERTTEIGIRKAIGADRRAIIGQFLAESVALATVGSAIGTVVGIAVAQLARPVINAFAPEPIDFHAVITPATLLIVAVVAVVVGCVFGTYPALRAARLDPVAAIQRA